MSADAAILSALRGAGPGGIAASDLAARAGIAPDILRDRIGVLSRNGFRIECDPVKAFRLLHSPDRLMADHVVACMGERDVVGSTVRVLGETSSTNEVAFRWARAGAREGTTVLTEHQSHGRGRMGRSWQASRGSSLLLSVLLHPPGPPARQTRLTILAAAALTRAIEGLVGEAPSVKWPNDILVEGRKMAGILTEVCADSDGSCRAVVGIGLNVNQSEADFPPELHATATSLRLWTGREWNRNEVAARLLVEMDSLYRMMRRGEFFRVLAQWRERCATLGESVTLRLGHGTLHGVAEALEEDGSLLLRTAEGNLERIHAGDPVPVRTGP